MSLQHIVNVGDVVLHIDENELWVGRERDQLVRVLKTSTGEVTDTFAWGIVPETIKENIKWCECAATRREVKRLIKEPVS